jgi:hypothetical protein
LPLFSQGLAGIYSPETGIIDWEKVAIEMRKQFEEAGGQVKVSFEANAFDEAPVCCLAVGVCGCIVVVSLIALFFF